jgi:hypothetical protein
LIELIDKIGILKEANKDSWGISVNSATPESVSCRVMYSLKSEPMKSANGDFINPTAKVYFEGLFDIGFGDKLVFTDDFGKEQKFIIHEIKPIKDFSGVVLFTRVVI